MPEIDEKTEKLRKVLGAGLDAYKDYCITPLEGIEEPEEGAVETCHAAVHAIADAFRDHLGTSDDRIETCREALRVTIVAICDYCGTERPTLNMLSKLQNLAEIIDSPEMFQAELDKLPTTGGAKDESKAAACREALRVTIVAICDYCGTERPTLNMLSKLQNLAEIIDSPEMFQAELVMVCR